MITMPHSGILLIFVASDLPNLQIYQKKERMRERKYSVFPRENRQAERKASFGGRCAHVGVWGEVV